MKRSSWPTLTRRDFLRASLQAGASAACLSAVGCLPSAQAPMGAGQPATQPQSLPKTLKTVTVSTTATGAGLLSEVIRREKYDEEFGLKIDYQTFTPGEAERATALRRVDAGLMVPQSVAQSNLEGIPLRIFMPQLLNHISLVVRDDAPYRDLEDLRGRKIGALAKVTSAYQTMLMIARLKSMDLERDFELVIGEAPILMSWLVRGDVEATQVFEPNTSIFLTNEKVRVLRDQQAWWEELRGGAALTGVLAAHQDWVEANRDVVKAIQQAYLKALQFISTRPHDLTPLYKEFFRVEDERILERLQQRMPSFYRLAWDEKTISSTREMVKLAVDLRILPEMPKDDIFVPLL